MATHSSILAWRISWAEEPGGLQSIGLQSWTRLKQLGGSSSRYESVLVTQSYPSLCDPMDYSLPGSSVHVIFQARILSGLLFPTPGDLPDPGIEPVSLASPAMPFGFLPAEPWGKPLFPLTNT